MSDFITLALLRFDHCITVTFRLYKIVSLRFITLVQLDCILITLGLQYCNFTAIIFFAILQQKKCQVGFATSDKLLG